MVAVVRNLVEDQAITETASIPAPVGGLNTRDSLANMPPEDAVILDNFNASASEVTLRRGSAEHGTGIGGATDSVETLAVWAGATEKMLAVSEDNKIYDVSSAGAGVDKTAALTITESRWQTTNFTSSAGQFLLLVNGVDTPLKYDGTDVTTNSWTATALTDTDVIGIFQSHQRLFLIEKDTMSFWFLSAVDVFTGAASEFPLGSIFSKGGFLMAGGTWSVDAGDGLDDKTVFVTSNGQVAVYAGIDPSSPSTWVLEGVYNIADPIGRRCLTGLGPELVITTIGGMLPMSKIELAGQARGDIAITDKISPTINALARSHSGKFGWEGILYPRDSRLIFNVPTSENAVAEQYVLNVITGAWSSWGAITSALNANTWAVFNADLYYGGNDGRVMKADTGTADESSNIIGDALPAFSYFGRPGQNKLFSLARAVMRSDGDLPITAELKVDFNTSGIPAATPSGITSSGATWDVTAWDTEFWGNEDQVVLPWIGVAGLGFSASLRMRVSTGAQSVSWVSTDYQYQVGGPI